ncbi:hypothetical protein AVEN_209312-1 [Araneus ventricosus]|uniref:Uncharacterized protein n=1 Tax=Araneus ventricosus TaxID=182803 RepID=A0A4Y2CAN1_ARAVE|nr:hypothetical protein AVEN_209312-1 [Araneus ventricosus]
MPVENHYIPKCSERTWQFDSLEFSSVCSQENSFFPPVVGGPLETDLSSRFNPIRLSVDRELLIWKTRWGIFVSKKRLNAGIGRSKSLNNRNCFQASRRW